MHREARALDHFVEHCERITRAMLTGQSSAQWLVRVDEARNVIGIERGELSMAVYTDLNDEELADVLIAFDLRAPMAFKGIAEGCRTLALCWRRSAVASS